MRLDPAEEFTLELVVKEVCRSCLSPTLLAIKRFWGRVNEVPPTLRLLPNFVGRGAVFGGVSLPDESRYNALGFTAAV